MSQNDRLAPLHPEVHDEEVVMWGDQVAGALPAVLSSVGDESASPLSDRHPVNPKLLGHIAIRLAGRAAEQDTCSLRERLARLRTANPRLQALPLVGCQNHLRYWSTHRHMHAA